MSAEALLTDHRWEDEVILPVLPDGMPRPADGPRDHGFGLYLAFADEKPPPASGSVASFSLRRLLHDLPAHWALTIDPEESDPAWGSRTIDPRSPEVAVGLRTAVPTLADLLAGVDIRRLSSDPGPLREPTLLFRAVDSSSSVYAVPARGGVGWVVVTPQTGAAIVAGRLRDVFGRRPHPPILVTDESDVPPRARRKLEKMR
jgi:hypothetical protein